VWAASAAGAGTPGDDTIAIATTNATNTSRSARRKPTI
jgi:hypothetical protein